MSPASAKTILAVGILVFPYLCAAQGRTSAAAKPKVALGSALYQANTDMEQVKQAQSQTVSTPEDQHPGTINGTILDQSGAVSVGARVRLSQSNKSAGLAAVSGDDGQFSFNNIPPGPFQITVTASGFSSQTYSGELKPGETFIVPPIRLAVATQVTQVQVGVSPVEVAQAQVKEQEKQRVFAVIPNFYVSYVPDAAPLNAKQKFELAWRWVVDPFTFIETGFVAGLEQAGDQFPGYGQGVQGYTKRYGASYADSVAGTFIGGAILPSFLKQDPRFFYKGTGSTKSRLLYALASPVIAKGDNKRWQPNYSNILGSVAVGGISNLYYPKGDRNSAGLVFQNALIALGEGSVAGVFQEFVVRRLTPHLNHHAAPQP